MWGYVHDINGNLYKSYGSGTCNMTLSIYRPDGSCAYSYTYKSSDNNWIGTELNSTGKWTIESKITGSISGANRQTIRCTSTSSSSSKVNPTSVSLSCSSVTIAKGTTTSITAAVKPSNASNKSVTWSTSNSNVATVSNGKITGRAPGTATITAKTSNGKTASCKVYVKGISIIDTTKFFHVGDKYTLNTTSYLVSSARTWSSSDKSVATVDSSGRITVKKAGSVTITVKTQDGYSANISISVAANTTKAQGFFGTSNPVTVRLNKGCDKGKIKIKCKAGNGIDFGNEFIVTLRNKNGGQIWRGTVKSGTTLNLGNDHAEYVVCIERKNINNPVYVSNTFSEKCPLFFTHISK